MSQPVEKALLDFDSYLTTLPEDRQTLINDHLSTVTEAERGTEKQRLAAILAVSEAEQADPATVAQNWTVFRGSMAEKNGWQTATDGEFFGKLKEQAVKGKDERELLIGPDEDDNSEGRAESLVFKAQEAAYSGRAYADAFVEWEEAHKGRPGYDPSKASRYVDVAADAHSKMAETLSRVKPLAEQAFETMRKSRDGEGGDAAPFQLLRGLPPEEKQLAFRLMSDRVTPAEAKGFWQASGEAFGRGFENLVVGGGAGAWRSRLVRAKFKAGDKVGSNDAASEILADYATETGARMSSGTGGGGTPRSKSRTLTAEEAKQWNADVANTLEDLDTAESLRQFGQQVIDPTNKDGSWIRRKLWLPVMDSAAIMASMAIPGAWAPAIELGAQSYRNDAYLRFKAEGMTPEEADRLAGVTGLAQAALDKLQLGILTKGAPGVRQALQRFAMGGSAAGRFGVNAAGTLVAETAIELTQDHVIPALVQDNLSSNPDFDVNWSKVWGEAAAAAPDVALGMVLLSGLGGMAQTAQQSAFVNQLAGSKAAMRLRGYSLEQIDEIQASTSDAEKGSLLAQYLPAKAPRGVDKDAIISDVVKLAAQERQLFEEKTKADAANAMEAEAVSITRRGSGWWVDYEGKSTRVESAEAARRIRDNLKQASTLEEATAIVGLIDQWTAAAPEGTARETKLSGEVVKTDGQTATRSRWLDTYEDGSFSEEAMEELRREADMLGAGEVFQINGSNQFRRQVVNGASQLVQAIELNRSDSSVFTFLHEAVEAEFRRTGSDKAAQTSIAAMRDSFDPAKVRDEATRLLFERVQKVADGNASATELRETFSELAVADVLGRSKDGSLLPAGSISSALDAAIRDAVDAKTAKEIGKVRAFFRAVKAYFRALFATVSALRKAKRSGTGQEFESLVSKLLGIQEQETHDAFLSDEIEGEVSWLSEEEVSETPSEEIVTAAIEEVLTPEEKTELAEVVSEPEWTPQASRKFHEAFADWIAGARKITGRALELFRKVLGAISKTVLAGIIVFSPARNISDASLSGAEAETALSLESPREKPLSSRVSALSEVDYLKQARSNFKAPSQVIAVGLPTSAPRSNIKAPDFSGITPADGVATLANWVVANRDNGAAVFFIGDKQNGQGYLFDSEGKLVRSFPALFGQDIGDRESDGTIETAKKITPAGRFEADLSSDEELGRTVDLEWTGDEGSVVSIHRLYLGDSKENRPARLASRSAADNRISFGCINVAEDVMETAILPMVEKSGAVVYVMPESGEAMPIMEGKSFSLSKLTTRFANRGVTVDASEKDGLIKLSRVVVRESIRGNGIGSEFMRELTAYADRSGQRVALTPSGDFGGNVTRLRAFYRRFGFAENKGRSRDLAVSEAMIREPGVPAFSISAGSRLELTMKRLDAALARDPVKRRELARQANDKLQSLAFNWEQERWTPKGDEIRPLVEKRSPEQIAKEAAIREAFRREELEAEVWLSRSAILGNEGMASIWSGPVMSHLSKPGTFLNGRLKSQSAAMRGNNYGTLSGDYDGAGGVPRVVFGGQLAPDQAAQELFDDGLIREPTPDAMWEAIKKEVAQAERWKAFLAAARTELAEAKATAKAEAKAWQEDQEQKQAKDWSPKARLIRDLRTLDAILSVMPAEVRGKVGGFVKLAQLGTDKARAEEIGRRIEKLGALVESHLQKESTEALTELLAKAEPEREGGKKSKGKLGADVHRYFDEVSRVYAMTEAEVEAERAAIATLYAAPGLTDEQAVDLFEREQILDTFGNWAEKSAADMDSAVTGAQAVYDEGRNRWRLIEEARLGEVRDMAAQLVAAMGGESYAGSQAQKAAGKLGFLRKISLDLKSFAEVLDALLGANHPLAQRWTQAAREGFQNRNDEVRAARKRWKEALEAATGERGVKARRILWEMARKQTISVENAGKSAGSTVDVPISLVELWRDGLADPSALGYSADEAARLIAERDAMAPDDRRQNLSLSRAGRELGESVPMSQADGVFLTMLAAQEQYADALDKAGWTAEAVQSVEDQLTEQAKKLRTFMQAEYRDGYAPLAAQFESMFGVALPQIKNYAPAAFYHTGTEKEMAPEGGIAEGGMRSGFLKNRKRHVAAPKLENAFATFFGHQAQTAHWKGLAPFVRELSGVLGKPEVKRAIEAKRGPEMLKTLTDWQKNLEGNGLQVQAGLADKAVSWITSAQAYIALAFKLGTLVKQSSALLGAAFRMPLGAYARGLGRLLSGQLETAKVFNSAAIQRRLETGFAPEVRAAMADVWNAKPTMRQAFLERGMELIGWTDAFFTTGSAAIAYDYHLRQAKAAGLTDAGAEAEAMRQVEDIVSRTAQPADVVNRSLFEARQGAFGRLLFLFASEARQKSSLWLTAWGNTLTGKATKADARVLALSHFVLAPMMATITAAWRDARDDDDDEIFDAENWDPMDFFKAIVAGPLSGIPLIGESLSGFRSDGVLGRFVKAPGRLVDVIQGPEENEAEKAEWYLDRIAKLMQAADAFTGVAGSIADQLGSIADNFAPDSEEEQEKKDRAAARREREE